MSAVYCMVSTLQLQERSAWESFGNFFFCGGSDGRRVISVAAGPGRRIKRK